MIKTIGLDVLLLDASKNAATNLEEDFHSHDIVKARLNKQFGSVIARLGELPV